MILAGQSAEKHERGNTQKGDVPKLQANSFCLLGLLGRLLSLPFLLGSNIERVVTRLLTTNCTAALYLLLLCSAGALALESR